MNKKLVKIIVIALSAIIVVGTVIIGFCTHWFGLALGPMGKLIKATKNTLAAKSFVMELSIGGDEAEITYAKLGSKAAVMIDTEYSQTLIYNGQEYYITEDGYANFYDAEEYDPFFDAVDDINDGKEPDWDDIIEDLYAEDYIDDKHVDEFFDIMLNKKLTDKEWLEDYLGFDKDGNVFSFSFNLGDTYEEIIDIADDARVLKERKSEYMYDIDYMNEITVDAEIVVEKNKLAEIELTLSHERYNGTKISVSFSDYGEDVLDKDEVNDFIDEVEEAKEEYDRIHYCAYCGDWKSYGVCTDCDYYGYGWCDDCGYRDTLYDRNGTYYCYDCLSENFDYE